MTQIVDISALHAGLLYLVVLIFIFIGLTLAVVRHRRGKLIGIGDGGDKTMARWVRVHGNFSESATFGIPAIFGVVLAGAGSWAVHLVALLFIIGRLAHAQGLSSSAGSSTGRVAGMALTWASLLSASIIIVWRVLAG